MSETINNSNEFRELLRPVSDKCQVAFGALNKAMIMRPFRNEQLAKRKKTIDTFFELSTKKKTTPLVLSLLEHWPEIEQHVYKMVSQKRFKEVKVPLTDSFSLALSNERIKVDGFDDLKKYKLAFKVVSTLGNTLPAQEVLVGAGTQTLDQNEIVRRTYTIYDLPANGVSKSEMTVESDVLSRNPQGGVERPWMGLASVLTYASVRIALIAADALKVRSHGLAQLEIYDVSSKKGWTSKRAEELGLTNDREDTYGEKSPYWRLDLKNFY